MNLVDTARVLTDIQDGLVTQYPHDVYELPDYMYDDLDNARQYREMVLLLVRREWVMPAENPQEDGGHQLRLTSIGERRLIEARSAVTG